MSKTAELDKKDVESLVIADVIDLTNGCFDVTFESDDSGTHIQVALENHEDAPKIVKHFSTNTLGYKVLVLKVPRGYLGI